MCEYSFKYYDRTIYYYSEVDGSKAHEVCRHSEDAHEYKSKHHGQWYDRSHYHARPHIAQEDDEHKKYDDGTLYEVIDNGGDISVYKFGAVEIRFYGHSLGQQS